MPQTAVSRADLEKIICDVRSGDLLVQIAEQLGKELYRSLKEAAPIRAIYDEAHLIGSLFHSDPETAIRRIHLLKPKMAYRAARNRKVKPLSEVLSQAVDVVVQGSNPQEIRGRFAQFLEFFEAIVAYHAGSRWEGEIGG